MEVRYELVEKLREELKHKLSEITKDENKYKELVSKFIVQVKLI